MRKYFYTIILIFVALLLFLGGFYLYANRSTPQKTENEVNTNPQQDQETQPVKESIVKIGTEEVTGGKFLKVANENIYLLIESKETQLPLTKEEVVLACTKQNLSNANTLDFDQIEEVQTFTPSDLGSKIPPNADIVVFSMQLSGINTAHTIALASEKCPQ